VITYATSQAIVPTAQELQGIFPRPVCVSFSPTGTCQATSTQVTSFDPVAQAYIKDIYSKIPAGNPGNNTLTVPMRNVFNRTQELGRIDQNFTPKLSVFARFLWDDIPSIEPGGVASIPLPGVATVSTQSPGHSFVSRLTATISPTWVNEVGYAYSYGAILHNPVGLVSQVNSPDIRVPLAFPPTLACVPILTFGGAGGTNIQGSGCGYRDYNRNHEVWANSTKVAGKHSVKFGMDFYNYNKSENSAGGSFLGNFTFSGSGAPPGTTAFEQAFANFLLGNVSSFTQNAPVPFPSIRALQYGFYAQDDFRALKNLTLNEKCLPCDNPINTGH